MRFFIYSLLMFLGIVGMVMATIVSIVSGVTSFGIAFPIGAILVWIATRIDLGVPETFNMDGVNPKFGRE